MAIYAPITGAPLRATLPYAPSEPSLDTPLSDQKGVLALHDLRELLSAPTPSLVDALAHLDRTNSARRSKS